MKIDDARDRRAEIAGRVAAAHRELMLAADVAGADRDERRQQHDGRFGVRLFPQKWRIEIQPVDDSNHIGGPIGLTIHALTEHGKGHERAGGRGN